MCYEMFIEFNVAWAGYLSKYLCFVFVYEAPFIHKQTGQCADLLLFSCLSFCPSYFPSSVRYFEHPNSRQKGNKQNKLKMSICQQQNQHQWLTKVSQPIRRTAPAATWNCQKLFVARKKSNERRRGRRRRRGRKCYLYICMYNEWSSLKGYYYTHRELFCLYLRFSWLLASVNLP